MIYHPFVRRRVPLARTDEFYSRGCERKSLEKLKLATQRNHERRLPNMAKKVLLVSTSAGQMGEHPTGLWISELAEPYTVFTKAGFDVTIASIAGGAVPIDAGSLAEPFFAPDAKAFMHDAKAFGALSHSVKVDAAMAGQYDAVCLCGGHGTCVDFYGPAAAALKAVVEGTYAAGKVVGAVCHGPIGLISCNKPDGTPLVAGLEVTCFSDARTSVL